MKRDLRISYPGSEKVYMRGSIHPSVSVGMRMVTQMPTITFKDGEREEYHNPPIYIYDTSGPYGDKSIDIDLNKGLPNLRGPWIAARKERDASKVCQMYYAKQHPGVMVRDNALSKARYEFRWKDQFNLSLDPERALEYYKTTNNVGGRYCTMCGPNFCAMKISHTLCDEEQ